MNLNMMSEYNQQQSDLSASLEEKSILIVEDDPDIAELIRIHLSDIYTNIQVAGDGLLGLEMAISDHWDLIVLDLRLPGKNGLDVCRDLRKNEQYVPILMLTSKSNELDRVLGLEIGADDYLTKPFSIIELAARIKAIFRRLAAAQNDSAAATKLDCKTHELTMDTRLHQVEKQGQKIELTTKEFDLLYYFLCSPGTVFSRAHLLNKIWGHGHEGYEHTVNSHINRLRSKIENDPTDPQIITTVWGVGYKLSV